jgi:hypothetical protein
MSVPCHASPRLDRRRSIDVDVINAAVLVARQAVRQPLLEGLSIAGSR